MNLKDAIQNNKIGFLALCKAHEVESLYAFGSSVTHNFNNATSDIDFLIEIKNNDPLVRGEHLINIWDKFETFFQRKIDLLTNASIKNPILKESINATKTLIYDGKKQEIFI